jgi:hypothetical protein
VGRKINDYNGIGHTPHGRGNRFFATLEVGELGRIENSVDKNVDSLTYF